jgi:hypothetical protein
MIGLRRKGRVMKYQSRVSIVLALSVFITMLSFPLTVQGQPPIHLRGDTGVIYVGGSQVMRITVNGLGGADAIRVRFAWMKYMPAGCNADGVCRHTIQSQGVTAPVNIGANQAASYDVQGTGGGVRVSVFVAAGDVNGDAQIINAATGEVTSHVVIWFVEGDF